MSIIIEPLRKDSKQLQLINEPMRKSAGNTIGGKMPTIYVARADESITKYDEDQTAAVGFRYRRQSHHCEVTWWGGRNEELVAEALKAAQCAAILEGRKRIEIFSEENWADRAEPNKYPHPEHERGGERFDKALELANFKDEGVHRFWTKYLEDVKVYGWVWLHDGLPEFQKDTIARLGENETTLFYAAKNIELYVKDRDYYSRVEDGSGLSFAQHIENAMGYVRSLPQVEIIEDWSVKI